MDDFVLAPKIKGAKPGFLSPTPSAPFFPLLSITRLFMEESDLILASPGFCLKCTKQRKEKGHSWQVLRSGESWWAVRFGNRRSQGAELCVINVSVSKGGGGEERLSRISNAPLETLSKAFSAPRLLAQIGMCGKCCPTPAYIMPDPSQRY